MLSPNLAFILGTTSLMTLRSMLQLSFASQLNFCSYLACEGHLYVVHMLICPLVPHNVAVYMSHICNDCNSLMVS